MHRPLALAIPCLTLALGCSKPAESTAGAAPAHAAAEGEHAKSAHGEEPEGKAAPEAAEGKGKKKSKKKASKAPAAEAPAHAGAPRFAVPFVWETSPNDPLARARGHLKEIIADNGRYSKEHGARFFEGFAAGQKPRSTVIACSDSRLQMSALDASPENDAFVVRNIGNQIENSLGSVEYGIDDLHTSVLLIVGHTGCGAVKAAMGKSDGLSEPVQREIASLRLATTGVTNPTDQAWADAVIENVNNQVDLALDRYGTMVNEGKLTVIGTVYDFRNDLKQGSGKLVFINVNGNTDGNAIRAFIAAVSNDSKIIVQTRENVPIPSRPEPAEDEEHEAALVDDGH